MEGQPCDRKSSQLPAASSCHVLMTYARKLQYQLELEASPHTRLHIHKLLSSTLITCAQREAPIDVRRTKH